MISTSVSDAALDAFHDAYETDTRICQNCFADRPRAPAECCPACGVTPSCDAPLAARTWGSDNPLPKSGEQISFFRLLGNLRDRLEERGHNVDWSRWKTQGARLKTKQPSEDRVSFALLVHDAVSN